MKRLDLSGQVFSRLTALSAEPVRQSGHVVWLCQCVCGTHIRVTSDSLTTGNTNSCGCLHLDTVTVHGHARRGQITLAFRRWQNMLARCGNSTHPRYARYGGRGITVCETWKTFATFYADMGECAAGMSLERIDNDKGYSPNNCKWATRVEQMGNRSVNRTLTLNRETHCLSEWARITQIPRSTLAKRLKLGWASESILRTPASRR